MILDEICDHKRQEVASRKHTAPLARLEERIKESPPTRGFRAALREPGISLIAEIKRASPSKGTMLDDVDPIDLAFLYEQNGARAISVLTDERYFKGTLDDLTSARQNVALPCLRKEFVIDEYQVYEARAAQADAVLLIVRALSDPQLKDFIELSTALGMDALVEAHDAKEIEQALGAGAHIVGINNRDLASFEVNLATTIELRRFVSGGHVLVSESGIHSREHVRMLEDSGVDAILVGEALVTSNDIGGKIRELLGLDEA